MKNSFPLVALALALSLSGPAAVLAITGIAAGIAASTYYTPPPPPVYVQRQPVYIEAPQAVYVAPQPGYWRYPEY